MTVPELRKGERIIVSAYKDFWQEQETEVVGVDTTLDGEPCVACFLVMRDGHAHPMFVDLGSVRRAP